jgi:hypothetical protein
MRSAIAILLLACSSPAIDDAGQDAGAPDAGADSGTDLELSAIPDPAERSDCVEAIAAGEVIAKHVSCDAELTRGALAMGRVGDIVLANARARFVVRTGEESATTIGAYAGGLIDAAPTEGTDLLKEIFPIFEFVGTRPGAIEVVSAGGTEARVRVLFEDEAIGLIETVAPGAARPVHIRGRVDYVLRPDEDALDIEVEATTERGFATARGSFGLLALLGGCELVQPAYGVVDDDHLGGAGSFLVGERPESAFAISIDGAGSLLHVDSIQLLRGERLVLARGSSARTGARLSVSSTAAHAYAALARGSMLTITGNSGDRIEITGATTLRTTLDSDGRAIVPLDPGQYELRAGFDSFFEGSSTRVTAPGTVTLTPAPAARLRIAADVEGDAMAPVRVTVERGGEELVRFIAMGPTERRIPPGPTRITVSHGLEHDISQTEVNLVDAEILTLTPSLARVIDTSGWVSVDLHLHSELSTDSTHPAADAVRMIAAEGLEVVSATDHDFLTDYAAIDSGVRDRLVIVTGEEVSTTVFGHINGYPLHRDPSRAGANAVVWFDRSPTEIFQALRDRGETSLGGALVQINHPRLGSASFFGALALDASGHASADPMSLGLPAGTDLDDFGFEVLEIFNGYTRGGNEESFADYLSLFSAGRRFAMVGNSDTHRPTLPAGSPRSFVRVPDDRPGMFGWQEVATSIRAREITIAGTLFVTAELAGPRAGDRVPVHVRVQAPPWTRADRLRIYAGTNVSVDRAISGGFDEIVDVDLLGASFVVVRADSALEPAPMQHFEAFGITNPILVP